MLSLLVSPDRAFVFAPFPHSNFEHRRGSNMSVKIHLTGVCGGVGVVRNRVPQ